MSYFLRFSVLIAGVMISSLSFAPAAMAIRIESSQHGVIFIDDFESVTAGSFPNNAALPGTWAGNPPPRVTVVSDAVPGAFQGTNYLKLHRETTFADSFAQFASTPVTIGFMHTEVMLYIPSGNQSPVEIVVSAGLEYGGFPSAWVTDAFANPNGDVTFYNHALGQTVDTGIDYEVDVWQKWELDHDIAGGTFTITVDGNSTSALPFIDPIIGGEGIRMVSFRVGNDNAVFYMDAVRAVPEPASIALLIAGAVGLSSRRSHKRCAHH